MRTVSHNTGALVVPWLNISLSLAPAAHRRSPGSWTPYLALTP